MKLVLLVGLRPHLGPDHLRREGEQHLLPHTASGLRILHWTGIQRQSMENFYPKIITYLFKISSFFIPVLSIIHDQGATSLAALFFYFISILSNYPGSDVQTPEQRADRDV